MHFSAERSHALALSISCDDREAVGASIANIAQWLSGEKTHLTAQQTATLGFLLNIDSFWIDGDDDGEIESANREDEDDNSHFGRVGLCTREGTYHWYPISNFVQFDLIGLEKQTSYHCLASFQTQDNRTVLFNRKNITKVLFVEHSSPSPHASEWNADALIDPVYGPEYYRALTSIYLGKNYLVPIYQDRLSENLPINSKDIVSMGRIVTTTFTQRYRYDFWHCAHEMETEQIDDMVQPNIHVDDPQIVIPKGNLVILEAPRVAYDNLAYGHDLWGPTRFQREKFMS